jgi:hypothetical protein
MRGAVHQLPQYAFIAWWYLCLTKHRYNFTFFRRFLRRRPGKYRWTDRHSFPSKTHGIKSNTNYGNLPSFNCSNKIWRAPRTLKLHIVSFSNRAPKFSSCNFKYSLQLCSDKIMISLIQFHFANHKIKSRDSSVGIALGYGLDDRCSRVRFPEGTGNFHLHHRVQKGSGFHPASYPMGSRGSFPDGKAAGAWNWPLTSI